MLILTLDELGGASHALPFPCRRCLPYARDPGVMTLIFFRGAYFVDHQMSSFHSTGHYEGGGDRLALFNDPNCPGARNVHVGAGEGSLHLEAIADTCAYEGERATDLATEDWTRIRCAGARSPTCGRASSAADLRPQSRRESSARVRSLRRTASVCANQR